MTRDQDPADSAAAQLLDQARDAHREGRPEEALDLLADAGSRATAGVLKIEIEHLRGQIEMWMHTPLGVNRSLLRGAEAVAAHDADRATAMAAEAVGAAFMGGNAAAIRNAATMAEHYAERANPEAAVAARIAALEVAVLLDGSPQAAEELHGYVPMMMHESVLRTAQQPVSFFAMTMLYLERHADAQLIFDALIECARADDAPAVLPYPLAGLAEAAFRSGDWKSAYSLSCDATTIADDTNQPSVLAFALTGRSRIEAALGRSDEAIAHVEQADALWREHGISSLELYCAEVRGFIHISLREWDDAVRCLERARDIARTHGVVEPGLSAWGPNLIETYTRLGRAHDAEILLVEIDEVARRVGRSWCLAALDRCRGIAAEPQVAEDHFLRALEHHSRSLVPFETARTQFAYAEVLLQSGRDGGAVQLDAARSTFSRLGATPWLEQVDAAKCSANPRLAGRLSALTPQELEVARIVARGMTNKEAAAELFVSVKTIEAHLGAIYRKLEVRSRTELAVLINRN